MLLPRFLDEKGVHPVLDAIERKDPDYFIPVWFAAGFRFTPLLYYRAVGVHRIGILGFPMPRESTEAYLGAIVGSTADAGFRRYILWERSTTLGFPGETGTVLGEWGPRGHSNHGEGPAYTGDVVTDLAAFYARVAALLQVASPG
jgi:hypothetical protein